MFYETVTNVTIWGNHSTTQVPDFVNAKIDGKSAVDVISDEAWLEEEFTPAIQTSGGLLIKKWGRSSAASTAVSIADAIKALVTPTREGDWFSSAVCTDGNPYGIAEGIIFSMPCRSTGDGSYEIVEGLEINDWLRERIKKSEDELTKEADCVSHLTGKNGGACELAVRRTPPGLASERVNRNEPRGSDRVAGRQCSRLHLIHPNAQPRGARRRNDARVEISSP